MKPLRTFRLEEYLGEWEFKVRYHLTASDAESITVEELLAFGTDADREGFMKLPLSYIETWGTPELREAIASTYERVDAEHVLAFAGAEEALFWTMQELVGPGDHAVITVPCYQAMETVTLATGADVSALVPRREDGWALDLDELRALLRPTTRLVAVNFPNNPTGYVPPEATLRELAALCDEHGIRLFCDEVYRGIEVDPARTITQAADLSETALSLNVASKSYGLPGLRVGWIACRDRALLERLEKRKHYTSICNAGPAEYLAAVALRPRAASGSAIAASSPPTGRSSTTSSPAGRTSSTGSRRWAAASASRGTRAATSRSSARGCSTRRASSSCRRASTTRRSPTRQGPLPCRNRKGRASKKGSQPSTASCGHRTEFAARGGFRTAAVRYLLRLPAAVILGASAPSFYLVDATLFAVVSWRPGWNPHAFLRTHGGLCARRIQMSEELYEQMKQSVIDGEVEDAERLAQEGLDAGLSAGDILDKGFVKGIEEVGDLFGKGEFFLPELVQGAEAMKAAVAVLQPALDASKEGRQTLGKAVAGTVAGDIHEIGKTIVSSMLSAAGFEVVDIGCDVPVETFIAKVTEEKADLLLLSALLTTTMPNQQKTIEALKAAGLRDGVKVMIGGAPTTRAWADEIGADGYAEDAIEAVATAKTILGVG